MIRNPSPFRVGARVQDEYGNVGTVESVPRSRGGAYAVRMDPTGSTGVRSFANVALLLRSELRGAKARTRSNPVHQGGRYVPSAATSDRNAAYKREEDRHAAAYKAHRAVVDPNNPPTSPSAEWTAHANAYRLHLHAARLYAQRTLKAGKEAANIGREADAWSAKAGARSNPARSWFVYFRDEDGNRGLYVELPSKAAAEAWARKERGIEVERITQTRPNPRRRNPSDDYWRKPPADAHPAYKGHEATDYDWWVTHYAPESVRAEIRAKERAKEDAAYALKYPPPTAAELEQMRRDEADYGRKLRAGMRREEAAWRAPAVKAPGRKRNPAQRVKVGDRVTSRTIGGTTIQGHNGGTVSYTKKVPRQVEGILIWRERPTASMQTDDGKYVLVDDRYVRPVAKRNPGEAEDERRIAASMQRARDRAGAPAGAVVEWREKRGADGKIASGWRVVATPFRPRSNPAPYDVAAIKRAARAAGHPVYSVKNGTGSLRGLVSVYFDEPLPGPEAMSRASEWMRARYPDVPFSGLKGQQFCDYWLRYSAAERKAKNARPTWGVRGNPDKVARAVAALEAARNMPIRRPGAAGHHLADERARDKAVRAARAAYHVAVDERDGVTVKRNPTRAKKHLSR